MIRRSFLALTAASSLALAAFAPAFAQDAENILVLEIAGKANGTVEIELLPDLAPQHVEQIKTLTREGAYDDVAFHRVMQGFMAQTGDVEFGTREAFPRGRAGTGGSQLPDLPAEFSSESFERGVVGMARAQSPNSANSQFFIMFAPGPFLDGKYTIVGKVISGMEVVDEIQRGEGDSGSVADPDYIVSAKLKGG